LVNTGPDSNHGEIFYSLVPDVSGTRTCSPLSKERATELTLDTFIHEFQHMISYNQHVLVRGGRTDEDLWLNEGLSHIAEELGSLYYEAKYPAPTGRTDPAQLFPDSSQAFIKDDIADAYDYLSHTATTSVTMEKGSANPDERGAIWLFLRWLGDLKGPDVYRRLEQTNLTGRANVESASGEPLAALLGDFGIALWTDSLPGVARSAIPARNRFATRNLREIFKRLHDVGAFPLEYPLVPKNLAEGSDAAGALVRGTMDFYILPSTSGATLAPTFTGDDGKALSAALGAQLGVFRLPSP